MVGCGMNGTDRSGTGLHSNMMTGSFVRPKQWMRKSGVGLHLGGVMAGDGIGINGAARGGTGPHSKMMVVIAGLPKQ